MSVSIEVTPLPSFGQTTEETPPKPWTVDEAEAAELERAYQDALKWAEDTIPGTIPTDAETKVGPLVPDELEEEALPPDEVIVDRAVARYQRTIMLACLAITGLVLGIGTALVL